MAKARTAARTTRQDADGPASTYDIAVLQKALAVLEVLSSGRPAGLTEIAREAGTSKPSTFRILSTLESAGFADKDPVTRQYRPGSRLIGLGAAVVASRNLAQLARPVMEELADRYRETVNLGVLTDGSLEYLAIIESRLGLRMAAAVGDTDTIHSTALGKAMLSAMPRPEAMELLSAHPRERKTPRTLVELSALEADLVKCTARGYAYDDQENEIGARCVAAAIRSSNGRPVGAISISGPAARLSFESLEMIGEDVRRAAGIIEQRLGVTDPKRAEGS